MRPKPRIEKRDGYWRIALPVFGFASGGYHKYVTGFRSQPAAMRWLEAHHRYRTRGT